MAMMVDRMKKWWTKFLFDFSRFFFKRGTTAHKPTYLPNPDGVEPAIVLLVPYFMVARRWAC